MYAPLTISSTSPPINLLTELTAVTIGKFNRVLVFPCLSPFWYIVDITTDRSVWRHAVQECRCPFQNFDSVNPFYPCVEAWCNTMQAIKGYVLLLSPEAANSPSLGGPRKGLVIGGRIISNYICNIAGLNIINRLIRKCGRIKWCGHGITVA